MIPDDSVWGMRCCFFWMKEQPRQFQWTLHERLKTRRRALFQLTRCQVAGIGIQ
jgi:hypothetical protein